MGGGEGGWVNGSTWRPARERPARGALWVAGGRGWASRKCTACVRPNVVPGVNFSGSCQVALQTFTH